jgi:hypothetical protein
MDNPVADRLAANYAQLQGDIAILAREAASVLRGFYDDVTPCVHRLKNGERCRLCGRAKALLIECDAIVDEARIDGTVAHE